MAEEALAKALPEGFTMADIHRDNAKTARAKAADAALDAKLERAEMGSHRGLKNGRNFLWNVLRHKSKAEQESYRANFDSVFPDAPGAGL